MFAAWYAALSTQTRGVHCSLRPERFVSLDDFPQTDSISPALLAAQTRLLQLRAAEHGNDRLTSSADAQARLRPKQTPNLNPPTLPTHLGWGSRSGAQAISIPKSHASTRAVTPLTISAETTPPIPPCPRQTNDIVIHPALAQAMLLNEQVAPGRIWLLLRHIDQTGCGWISLTEAQKHLAMKASELRVCGNRQLRNLLRQGDGIFWQRGKDRIWLRSLPRVAAALNVTRFSGAASSIPATALCGTIGTARAQLYAACHNGRESAPVARATLHKMTGVAASSQRNYEQQSGVTIRPNFAIMHQYGVADAQEAAWQHGQACFHFTDHNGRLGPRKAKYIARRLPNSYIAPQPSLGKRQNRRLNRALTDLLPSGTTGNGRPMRRVFFRKARAAVRAKGNEHAVYWQTICEGFWHQLEPEILCGC